MTAPRPRTLSDETAYFIPMAVFMLFTWIGGTWTSLYPASYIAKTIIVAALLFGLRGHFTEIRWNAWWLGILGGVIGIVQWIAMQLFLQRHFSFFKPSPDVFDPTQTFHSRTVLWSFVAVRIIGATLVVPVMEELFWRDFLWRTVLAPNNFKLAKVGEGGWSPFLIVAGAFATVHGNWWLTAIVWALMIGTLLVTTKSLGACILMHGTTNLLLALYVLHTHDWSFW